MNALQRAQVSLEGLSVGDAFGEQFFGVENSVLLQIGQRAVPRSPWRYTDDTQMALSIVATLEKFGSINQDFLARDFAERFILQPARGYGGSMHDTLRDIYLREPWKQVTERAFKGMGSWGNGAAMRVAPIGAYFADDVEAAASQARDSAVVTHAHPEAAAGAVGVAVASALAHQWKELGKSLDAKEFLEQVAAWIPESEVKTRTLRASTYGPETPMMRAVMTLGNGIQVSAHDTVPLALWCAALHLNDFAEALWFTVGALGDRDTTCAMVGGIVACYVGLEGIPQAWREAREPLPEEFDL